MSRNDIPTAKDLVFQILRTAQSLEQKIEGVLAHCRGISNSEYQILCSLAEAPHNRQTRVAIARNLYSSPSGITRALKPLEKLGYVVTEKNERDARQSFACLTDVGRELIADSNAALEELFSEFDQASLSQRAYGNLLKELARMEKQL